jgi:DNA-binding NarL/FixJ family response regulator
MRAPSSHQPESTRVFPKSPIRILTVGSRSIVRARLRLLIESRPGLMVVGETDSHAKAIAIACREKPDVVLLDVHTDTLRCINGIPELVAAASARVLVLNDVYDIEIHRRAVRSGAHDLVVMERLPDALLIAINPEAEKIAKLTPRERAIIASIALGLNDKKTAARLGLPETTVHTHLKSVFRKLAVADRLELLIYSFLNGLVEGKQRGRAIVAAPWPMTLSKGPKMKSGQSGQRSARSR